MLAACHQSVTDLPQPNQDGGMEAWLIERLRLSLDALSKSVSRNVDDAATLCHVALNRLLQHESVVVADPAAVAQCWPTAAARRAWEKSFEDAVVAPMMQDLDRTLQQADEQVKVAAAGDEGYSRRLMHELQESTDPASLSAPLQLRGGRPYGPQQWTQLWRFRTRVTVAHFTQRFATSTTSEARAECLAVQEFISAHGRIILGATHHLPDILRLQRALRARLERRISKEEAAEGSLQAKLDSIWSSDADQREKEELVHCAESFICAWGALQPIINEHVGAVLQLDDTVLAQTLTLASPLQVSTARPRHNVGLTVRNRVLCPCSTLCRARPARAKSAWLCLAACSITTTHSFGSSHPLAPSPRSSRSPRYGAST
jgi:hypothetical protein